MTVFRHVFPIQGDRGFCEPVILFDNGATLSMIRPEMAGMIATPLELGEPELFDGARSDWRMRADVYVPATIRIGDGTYDGWFYVVGGLADDVVAGADFLQEHGFIFDYRRHQVRVGRNRFDLAPPPPRRR